MDLKDFEKECQGIETQTVSITLDNLRSELKRIYEYSIKVNSFAEMLCDSVNDYDSQLRGIYCQNSITTNAIKGSLEMLLKQLTPLDKESK